MNKIRQHAENAEVFLFILHCCVYVVQSKLIHCTIIGKDLPNKQTGVNLHVVCSGPRTAVLFLSISIYLFRHISYSADIINLTIMHVYQFLLLPDRITSDLISRDVMKAEAASGVLLLPTESIGVPFLLLLVFFYIDA